MCDKSNDTQRDVHSMTGASNADRAASKPWAFVPGERQTMTITELARILGISRNSCYEYARRNELPVRVVRIGRRLLVSRAQVFRFLEGQDRGGQ